MPEQGPYVSRPSTFRALPAQLRPGAEGRARNDGRPAPERAREWSRARLPTPGVELQAAGSGQAPAPVEGRQRPGAPPGASHPASRSAA